jgi:CRISPR type IV-associated protein Csf3
MPSQPIALDALVMAAVALRDNLLPPEPDTPPIDIPIAQERGIYLATVAQVEWETYDRHWINRRFPIEEAQAIGAARVKRINLSGGPTKSYRLPLEVGYVRDGIVRWWCVGDTDPLRTLLVHVTHLGKRRAVGKGEVTDWTVEACATWPGFPVVRDGRPLRPLPLDWPGVNDADRGMRVLTPPYWQRWREEECLC